MYLPDSLTMPHSLSIVVLMFHPRYMLAVPRVGVKGQCFVYVGVDARLAAAGGGGAARVDVAAVVQSCWHMEWSFSCSIQH